MCYPIPSVRRAHNQVATTDALGRRTEVTDALGNVTHTAYDSGGRVIKAWGATYPVEYGYDQMGRMTSMKTFREENGSGDETRWLYENATGLLTSKVYADGNGPGYSYEADGKLASRLWARGVSTTYSYDGGRQLVGVDYSDDTTDIAYSYDRLGRKRSVVDASGTRTFTYILGEQILNDVIQFSNGVGSLREYYDSFGRSTGYAVSNTADGVSSLITGIVQSYDAFGRVSEVSVAGIHLPFRYGWLPCSDLQQYLGMPNGVIRQNGYEERRDYPVSIIHTNIAGAMLTRRSFSFDAVGRLKDRTWCRMGDATNCFDAFGYNSCSELEQAVLGTNTYAYVFDSIGNRRTAMETDHATSYSVNNLNIYTNIQYMAHLLQPTADADGNQTLIRTETGIWHVEYNAENRPVVFSNDAVVVKMAYDFMGRRSEYVRFVNGIATYQQRYFYRGYLQIAAITYEDSNVKFRAFAWDCCGTDVAETRPLALISGTNWWCYSFDQVKNVTELFGQSGEIEASYDYSPFGRVAMSSGLAKDVNPLTFSSEVYDSEIGLQYYNYRHYNPFDGRWISRDQIEELGGVNLYVICGNSVLTRVDLFGLSGWDYIPIISTLITLINNYRPEGSDVADYPQSVSKADCCQDSLDAEAICRQAVIAQQFEYAKGLTESQLESGFGSFVATFLGLAYPPVAIVSIIDGLVNAALLENISLKIAAGGRQAQKELCDCRKYDTE